MWPRISWRLFGTCRCGRRRGSSLARRVVALLVVFARSALVVADDGVYARGVPVAPGVPLGAPSGPGYADLGEEPGEAPSAGV